MRITRLTVGCAALALATAACGAPTDERAMTTVVAAATTPATSPTTTPTTTIAAPTTIAPTTTPAPTTTLAPTTIPETTVPLLPSPVPPPENAYADEAEVLVGRIAIPKIGVDRDMFSGITLTTLDKGPGHWPGTAEPGNVGNAVIAGHRTSHDKPFENLDRLEPGDPVVFDNLAGRHTYRVRETQIVFPDAMWIVDQTAEKTATLFACHPKGSTKQRIVVFLDYVETTPIPA